MEVFVERLEGVLVRQELPRALGTARGPRLIDHLVAEEPGGACKGLGLGLGLGLAIGLGLGIDHFVAEEPGGGCKGHGFSGRG